MTTAPATGAPPRCLILNADDFGYSKAVNAAVLRAHRMGTLTSASLMVAEAAWEEAVELALLTPTLGVGLHVSVSLDRSVLPPEEISGIVGADGHFGSDPFRVGLKYAFSRTVRPQLMREMEAQFNRFASTGLPWSHADGHQHFHLHPAVWPCFMDLCDSHDVSRIRLPHEGLRAHLRSGGDKSFQNMAALLVFRALRNRALKDLARRSRQNKRRYFVCDRVYGMLQTGNMNSTYLSRLLPRMEGVTREIYFHPASPHSLKIAGSQRDSDNKSYVDDVELAALLDADLPTRIQSEGLFTGTYPEVESMLASITTYARDSCTAK